MNPDDIIANRLAKVAKLFAAWWTKSNFPSPVDCASAEIGYAAGYEQGMADAAKPNDTDRPIPDYLEPSSPYDDGYDFEMP